MIKRKLSIILALVLLASSCTDDQRKQAAKASDDLARGLSIAFELDAALIDQKLISNDEAIVITSALLDVNRIVKQFNDTAKTFSKIDAPARTALLAIVADLARSLEKLNQQGVLRIKNPDAQAKFRVAVSVMTSAVAVLSALLSRSN